MDRSVKQEFDRPQKSVHNSGAITRTGCMSVSDIVQHLENTIIYN